MSTLKTRPRNFAEMAVVQGRLFSKDALEKGLRLQLRPTDIVVTPFGKSGTTWIQQIVHCLRTGGDMDFDDISRVVPWIETSANLGIDLSAEQRANPRAYKSHLDYEQIPKGGKYINSIRDPKDALYSAYKFFEGWFFEPGSISLTEFAEQRFIQSGAYWKHLVSWWKVKDEPNVLFLCYEIMKQDLEGTIKRIAAFMEIELTPELLEITLLHASLPFMQQHKDRFDDALMRARSEDVGGLPQGSDSAKVRNGQVGEHKEALSASVLEQMDSRWKQDVTPITGFETYELLIASQAIASR